MTDHPRQIVRDTRGFYWRDYTDIEPPEAPFYSMPPVTEDNEPVEVEAIYVLQPASPAATEPNWTVLANDIRLVDGNHDLGASELASRLIERGWTRAATEPRSLSEPLTRIADGLARIAAVLENRVWPR